MRADNSAHIEIVTFPLFLAGSPSPPVGFHHPPPVPSAAALLRSRPSSPRSGPSASPRTPRGCGHRHCGRAFYHRATWGSSGPRRDGR